MVFPLGRGRALQSTSQHGAARRRWHVLVRDQSFVILLTKEALVVSRAATHDEVLRREAPWDRTPLCVLIAIKWDKVVIGSSSVGFAGDVGRGRRVQASEAELAGSRRGTRNVCCIAFLRGSHSHRNARRRCSTEPEGGTALLAGASSRVRAAD